MTSEQDTILNTFRQQIDAIDDQLFALLKERISVVAQVGEFKHRTNPGRYPLRPAREAQMIRRVVDTFTSNPPFPPAAAAAIWRLLIGASTSVESPLTVAAFTPDQNNDFYWLAREYFGPSAQFSKHNTIKRVMSDVMDGKASVGIVPTIQTSDTDYWWMHLLEPAVDAPKIFACIPFITPGTRQPTALAFGRIAPEESGDDTTLMVLEVEHSTSQQRIQAAFTTAMLEATWVQITSFSSDSRYHLLEIHGFITEASEETNALLSALGNAVIRMTILGAYATPIILK